MNRKATLKDRQKITLLSQAEPVGKSIPAALSRTGAVKAQWEVAHLFFPPTKIPQKLTKYAIFMIAVLALLLSGCSVEGEPFFICEMANCDSERFNN